LLKVIMYTDGSSAEGTTKPVPSVVIQDVDNPSIAPSYWHMVYFWFSTFM